MNNTTATGADKVGKTAKPTLYQSISDSLVRMIQNGDYKVGSKLPTEAELCVSFAVSRHTAREALRRIQELGLVKRSKRAGTIVVQQHPEPHFALALDTTDQLQHYLKTTDLKVSGVVGTLARHPGEMRLEDEPSDWLKVKTYRCVPNSKRAVSWTDIYIRKEYGVIVDKIGSRPGGVYTLFEEHCGEVVETIDLEISAATFPTRVAKRLGHEVAGPALLMIRRFRNRAGKLLEVAVSYYPPFEFRYIARLSRARGRHQTTLGRTQESQ